MPLMQNFRYMMAWVIISALLGAAGKYLLGINFWHSALIASIALLLNGIIAQREDAE
jgi:hypothetical protein